MRITSIAARTIRWSIASRGAARGRTERAAVVIEVRSDRGVVGLGEAAPLPGMSPDTLDDAERAIAAFAERAPFELADRETACALAAASATSGSRAATSATSGSHTAASVIATPSLAVSAATAPPAAGSPAARFAIETALLDALARERRLRLSVLLGSPSDGIPAIAGVGELRSMQDHGPATTAAGAAGAARRARTVPLAAVVDDPDAARDAFAAGIRCLKIKLGATDDPGRVFAIAAAAPGARLRIDANRSWPRAEVTARLAALSHLPIDYVEEPCRDAHLLLAEPLACKIALDESLASLPAADLRAALASRQLAALVLKPTLLGGLSAALALAELAHGSGVAAITSHGLEGPVGTAACAELALAIGGDHPVGLAAHAALDGWLVAIGQLAPDHVRAAAADGLGFADLDLAEVVRACTTAGLETDPSDRALRSTQELA